MCVFENWWQIVKLFSQMLWEFDIAPYLTKLSTWFDGSQRVTREQWKIAVFVVHSFPFLRSTLNNFLKWSFSCSFLQSFLTKTFHCSNQWVEMAIKLICIETINLLLSYCWAKTLNFAIDLQSLRVRDDHFPENSNFFLPKLYFWSSASISYLVWSHVGGHIGGG